MEREILLHWKHMIICFSSLNNDEAAAVIDDGREPVPYLAKIFGGLTLLLVTTELTE